MLWFTKSRRAQSDTDFETWIEGGVVPTLNAFDNGDVRATVLVVRMREGKPGGGKGPLISENRSLTLATANDQTLFIFYGNRVGDIRMQDDVINTLQARMGTGGNNMPMVAAIPIHDKATRSTGKRKLHNGEYANDGAGNGLGIGKEGDPMNTLTSGDRHAIVFSHTQGLDPQPSEKTSPTLRANGGGMAVAYDEFNDGAGSHAVVYEPKSAFEENWAESEIKNALRANASKSSHIVVSYDEFNDSVADTHHTLRSGTKQSTGVVMESQVRRLTPVECERLQGFPDDWTAGQSDTHRYKQMGNAVAVPVVEWILTEIVNQLSVE